MCVCMCFYFCRKEKADVLERTITVYQNLFRKQSPVEDSFPIENTQHLQTVFLQKSVSNWRQFSYRNKYPIEEISTFSLQLNKVFIQKSVSICRHFYYRKQPPISDRFPIRTNFQLKSFFFIEISLQLKTFLQ